jgi:hypothetical protein
VQLNREKHEAKNTGQKEQYPDHQKDDINAAFRRQLACKFSESKVRFRAWFAKIAKWVRFSFPYTNQLDARHKKAG